MISKGRVIKGIGGFYYVFFENGKVLMGKARGNLKRNKNTIYVGDLVECEISDNNEMIITGILERKNFLIRPPVSNLDMLVITFSVKSPQISNLVVDKLCAACEIKGIDIALCITKKDLLDEDEISRIKKIYSGIYPVVFINGITGENTDLLFDIIKGKCVAFAGPSGVGKSTLVNSLTGNDASETGNISEKTGRGRHTTRHVEIFSLKDNTYIYDTPGFTSLEIKGEDPRNIKNLFPEIRKRKGECRYLDCMHLSEPDCSVKKAVEKGEISLERYESYTEILKEATKWRK